MARSMTAIAEAIFWQAIEAFALRARTTPLGRKGGPQNVTLARTNRSTLSAMTVRRQYDGFSGSVREPSQVQALQGHETAQLSQLRYRPPLMTFPLGRFLLLRLAGPCDVGTNGGMTNFFPHFDHPLAALLTSSLGTI